jgi:membrane protein implicated in regulation of membrane protease activity
LALAAAILLAVFVLPPQWDVVAVVGGFAVEVGEAAFWWRWSGRRRPVVGVETFVGRTAKVTRPCRPAGWVRIDGELWRAVCASGADVGECVRVVAVDGLTLVVERP